MSKETIWKHFMSLGFTPEGIAALMGNFECESNCEACRLQGDFTNGRTKSHAYADDVNSGKISQYEFINDKKGWGIYQLTLESRKEGFIKHCKHMGYPIESEKAQCEYCYIELCKDFPKLCTDLLNSNDMYDLTSRVCKEFERPYFNNVDQRYNNAKDIYNKFKDIIIDENDKIDADDDEIGEPTNGVEITVPVLKRGCRGRAVYMMQCGLDDMGFELGNRDGDFGPKTEAALKEFQTEYMQTPDGICDTDEWQILLQ